MPSPHVGTEFVAVFVRVGGGVADGVGGGVMVRLVVRVGKRVKVAVGGTDLVPVDVGVGGRVKDAVSDVPVGVGVRVGGGDTVVDFVPDARWMVPVAVADRDAESVRVRDACATEAVPVRRVAVAETIVTVAVRGELDVRLCVEVRLPPVAVGVFDALAVRVRAASSRTRVADGVIVRVSSGVPLGNVCVPDRVFAPWCTVLLCVAVLVGVCLRVGVNADVLEGSEAVVVTVRVERRVADGNERVPVRVAG